MRLAFQLMVATLAMATGTAHAVVTSYADFTSFGSASSVATYTFKAVADDLILRGVMVAGDYHPYGGDRLTEPVSGVGFTAVAGFLLDAGHSGNATAVFSGQGGSPNTITVDQLGTSATAVGFKYGAYQGLVDTSWSATATSNGTDYTFSLTLPPAPNSYNFIGFTSPSAITKVVFSQPSDTILDIPTFYVGTVTVVPEPSLAVLFGVGLALIGTIARRKSR